MSDDKINDENYFENDEFIEDFDGNNDFPEIEPDFEEDSIDGLSDYDSEDGEIFEDFDEIDYTKPQQKEGVNWFNIGIIGVVVIASAALAYNLFPGLLGGGSATPQATSTQQVSAQQNQELAQQALTNDTNNQQPEQGFFDNPDLLNQPVEVQTTPAESTSETIEQLDVMPTLSDQEMNDLFAAIPLNEPNTPTLPESIDTLPLPSDANPMQIMDQVDNLLEQPQITQTQMNPVSNTDIEKLNTRIDDMNDQMESFMNRLDDKLDNLSTPAQQVNNVDNSEQFNQLQQTLSRLENRIEVIEAKPEAEIEPVQTSTPTPQVVIEEKAPDVLLPTPEPAKTVIRPKRREPAYVPPKMTYELRGVSDGQAVIAAKGTQNLQTVSVGTVVRGLGTIRSIAVENGQWVVRGTSGTVRQ